MNQYDDDALNDEDLNAVDSVMNDEKDDDDQRSLLEKGKDVYDDVKGAKQKVDDVRDLVDKIKNGNKSTTNVDTSASTDVANAGTDVANASTDAVNAGTDVANASTDAVNAGTDVANTGANTAQTANATNTGANVANTGTSAVNTGTSAVNTGTSAANAGASATNAGASAANAGAATSGTASAAGGVAVGGGALAVALIVVLIIFIIVGVIGFILNAPGLLTGKLSEFASSVSMWLVGENDNLNEKALDKSKRLDLLNYVNDMGIDVVGFGFVPSATYAESEGGNPESGEGENPDDPTDLDFNVDDQKQIVDYVSDISTMLNGGMKESEACTDDLLYYYLLANERAYTINDSGVLGKPIATLVNKIMGTRYWTGMLTFDEPEKTAGEATFKFVLNIIKGPTGLVGKYLADKASGAFEVQYEVNKDNKTLEISDTRTQFSWSNFLIKDKFSYSLDGWTGRYGMPIEYSLALHLATMSSGLVKDMISNPNLQSEVHVAIERVMCNFNLKLTTKSGKEIMIPYENGAVESLKLKIDNIILAKKNGRPVTNITVDDLSIKGIEYLVKNGSEWKNRFANEDDFGLENDKSFQGFSHHIDAIDAILGKKYFAVQISNAYAKDKTGSGYANFYRYNETDAYKNNQHNGIGDITDAIPQVRGDYSYVFTEGKYVATYNDAGTDIDPTTGKLATTVYLNKGGVVGDESQDGYPAFNGKKVQYFRFAYEKIGNGVYGLYCYYKYSGESEEIKVRMEECTEYYSIGNPGVEYVGTVAGKNISVVKLQGLDLDSVSKELSQEEKRSKLALICKGNYYRNMFEEIDWFLGTTNAAVSTIDGLGLDRDINNKDNFTLFINYQNSGKLYENENNPLKDKLSSYKNNWNGATEIKDFYYYTDIYDDLVKNYNLVLATKFRDDISEEERETLINEYTDKAYSDYVQIMKCLEQDRTILLKYCTTEKSIDELQRQFETIDGGAYAGIDVEIFGQIADLFAGNMDSQKIQEVEFMRPYIKYVIRHWYKDIIFEGIPGFDSVYTTSSEPIVMPFNDENNKLNTDLQIDAVFTPKDDKGTHKVQDASPYVVKGNVVYQDGVEVKNIESSVKVPGSKDVEGNEYCLGDGYRTTKKLFTESWYYTLDGSVLTSRSVFWQQWLENQEAGKQFTLTLIGATVENSVAGGTSVSGGRIWMVDEGHKGTNYEKVQVHTGDGSNSDSENDVMDAIKVHFTIPSGGMKYLAPSEADEKGKVEEHSAEEVRKSAEKINSEWEKVGVGCFRQHVSLDNQSEAGEIYAETGLTILKNCNTKDSEYIYRDLKEMLIELGYYTEAEFDNLEVNLKWFIPMYTPSNWPQNTLSDNVPFAAVLKPAEKVEGGASEPNKEAEPKQEGDSNLVTPEYFEVAGLLTQEGFAEGLEVVAPGACKVVKVKDNIIEIEFDANRQPSISPIHKYRMIIDGITVKGEDGKDLKEGTLLNEGDKIGETGTTMIKVYLKNDIGKLLSNVEEYMSPSIADLPEIAYFYFLPFESGGRPGTVGGHNNNEVAVGLCQWTALNNCNAISPLCQYLYERDPNLCAPLRTFISWGVQDYVNDYFSGNSQLVQAFAQVERTDREKFSKLQLEYAYQEKVQITKKLGCEWILDKSPVTVGTFFSLINWGPYMGWQNVKAPNGQVINKNTSDSDIIWALLNYACTKNSTVGSLNHRWTTQFKLALDLLNGGTPEGFDLEKFVFGEQSYAEYGNGKHMDSITNYHK